MLLQFKIYLIAVIYLFGALFMIFFPPRNYEQSGAKLRIKRSVVGDLKYPYYVEYEMLLDAADRMARSDPDVIQVVHLKPKTYENRTILVFELRSDKQSRKPGILIIGALSGMAWAASNAILELAEKLLYDIKYQTPFFNDYDWYLIPMGNPDGIRFTQNLKSYPPIDAMKWLKNLTLRMNRRPSEWLKNVSPEPGEEKCFGTNINRNFAYHWQDDVRKTPEICSQYYPGIKPFSSAEAKAIRGYVEGLGDLIHLAIHLHASFVPKKEYILYPWRYSLRLPSNYFTLQAIGEYSARQARLPDGRLYQVHQSSNDGRVAGSLIDFIAGVVGTDLVYLVKPYHQAFPNYTDITILETYVKKATTALLSIVRGWRSSTKLNTLSFFGRDVEF